MFLNSLTTIGPLVLTKPGTSSLSPIPPTLVPLGPYQFPPELGLLGLITRRFVLHIRADISVDPILLIITEPLLEMTASFKLRYTSVMEFIEL